MMDTANSKSNRGEENCERNILKTEIFFSAEIVFRPYCNNSAVASDVDSPCFMNIEVGGWFKSSKFFWKSKRFARKVLYHV